MAKQLGKYEIIRTLGQGAMGEVYLANHPTIGREVAIKTILPSASRGEDAEDRFRREALAAGNLNHPNLVTIYDFDKDGAVLYLVMEFVKGDDLEDLIAQRAMSQSQCLEVLAQICDGLSYAHRSGIIHRDIKPSNVRVVRDGKRILAKVMDFGIARIEDSGMTATGIVMGTVSYMAPEYIQSGKATALCDLWAVGVMLYECLSGRKPFQADNTTTILFKIVSETPQPVDPGVIQGVSPNVHAVLAKALAKDPEQRFQSADEFAKALRACKDPTWMGSIEDAMSKVFDRHLGNPGAAGGHGAADAFPVRGGGLGSDRGDRGSHSGGALPARSERTHDGDALRGGPGPRSRQVGKQGWPLRGGGARHRAAGRWRVVFLRERQGF
jgi:serine/threonine protein kinase